jgi:hypothetical protein
MDGDRGRLRGDILEIFDFGASRGTTSVGAPTGDCGDNPDPWLLDPLVSHGVCPLAPGPHERRSTASARPCGSGAADVRVDAAEATWAHFLCDKVTPHAKCKQQAGLIRHQLGEHTLLILEPATRWVPSPKQELGPK